MSNIQGFRLVKGQPAELQGDASDLDKPLQTLIEKNLVALPGIRLLNSGHSVGKPHGPDRSVRLDQLQAGRVQPRRYRNRRIGEFLKELEFTEGRCTGIPKIIEAMSKNGSPPAEFEFDEDHSYFMVRLPIHPAAQEVTESATGQEPGKVGAGGTAAAAAESGPGGGQVGTKSAPSRHQVGTKSAPG